MMVETPEDTEVTTVCNDCRREAEVINLPVGDILCGYCGAVLYQPHRDLRR